LGSRSHLGDGAVVPDDRDRRREADPLHDTVDESTGVVRDAVDPDNTPIDKLIALIREDVGLLSARDERLIRAVEAHRERAQERSEKRRPQPASPEVDRAQLVSLLAEDMAQWEPFQHLHAKAEAAHKLAEKAEARWKWPMRIASMLAAGALGVVGWVLSETRSSGYEARTTEVYRAQVDANAKAILVLDDALDDVLRELAEIRGRMSRGGYPIRMVPVTGPRTEPDDDDGE
jgi:hypothetical protein